MGSEENDIERREERREERKMGKFKVSSREREWVFLCVALLIGPHVKIVSFPRVVRLRGPYTRK